MGVYIWNRLPSEYQEVEYISSAGTSTSGGSVPYIDTGYKPVATTKVVADLVINDTKNGPIYGAFNSSASTSSRFNGWRATGGDNGLSFGYGSDGGGGSLYVNITTGTKYRIEQYAEGGIIYNKIGDTTHSKSVGSFVAPNINMYIFMRNGTSSTETKPNMSLYTFQIYESGTLKRDFIPCYRKSDSVIGLYDLVNNQFYTNSGTGTFSKGSDVNTYRESSLKNAYIGEVYEYSYDFRNKSSTILTNDGWTVWSGTLGFTSNGIYASSGTVRMKKGGINLTNANKLTMKLNGYFGTGEYGFRVAKITSSNQLSNYSGMYFSVGSQKSLSVNSSEFSQSGLTAGFYSPIAVFDFVNKTSKLSVNGYSDITHSLTDAEISAIKANTDNIFIYLINNNSSSYFQDIKLLVE